MTTSSHESKTTDLRGRFAQVEGVRETANPPHGTFQALKFAFLWLLLHHVVLQTEPILSFEVSSTVRGLLKPGIKSTQNMNYV